MATYTNEDIAKAKIWLSRSDNLTDRLDPWMVQAGFGSKIPSRARLRAALAALVKETPPDAQ
jgi:hypothetical protein